MTIYIVDIEAVDTRYTKQWKEYPPSNCNELQTKKFVISGGETSCGYNVRHRNFGGTNVYKSSNNLNRLEKCFVRNAMMVIISYTLTLSLPLYKLRYMAELWVLILLLAVYGMLVVMIPRSWQTNR